MPKESSLAFPSALLTIAMIYLAADIDEKAAFGSFTHKKAFVSQTLLGLSLTGHYSRQDFEVHGERKIRDGESM